MVETIGVGHFLSALDVVESLVLRKRQSERLAISRQQISLDLARGENVSSNNLDMESLPVESVGAFAFAGGHLVYIFFVDALDSFPAHCFVVARPCRLRMVVVVV